MLVTMVTTCPERFQKLEGNADVHNNSISAPTLRIVAVQADLRNNSDVQYSKPTVSILNL